MDARVGKGTEGACRQITALGLITHTGFKQIKTEISQAARQCSATRSVFQAAYSASASG